MSYFGKRFGSNGGSGRKEKIREIVYIIVKSACQTLSNNVFFKNLAV